ncbi:MAG: ABC transporter substrate-binding protein [Prochloraceae cyanobacterium]
MPRKKYKSLIAIALACFSLLIINSCQPNNIEQDGITKITFWHGINPPENRDIFNKLLENFNQTHENIQVEAIYSGQPDEQLPKIIASIVADEPPDLLWYVPQITGELLKFDALVPLEDWLDRSAIKSEIDPAMFATMKLDGHIWSVPFATNNAAMFYRPSLFQEAGITKLPETWSELETVAKQLTKDTDKDGRIDRHGLFLSVGKGEWTVFVWLPFIYSAGGEIVSGDRVNLNNPGAIKALEFGAKLVKEDLAMLSAPERGYELDDFLKGKAAMQITGPWTLAQLKQTNVDYGVFPIPKLEKKAAVVGGENLFVFQTTPEKEKATKEFLEYILGEEFQTEWALQTGYLPINLKAQTSEKYQEFIAENPVLAVFLEQMEWARSRPIIEGYTRLSENLGRAIEASLLQDKTPEAALNEAQKRIESNR